MGNDKIDINNLFNLNLFNKSIIGKDIIDPIKIEIIDILLKFNKNKE